jgi:predicted GTPase
MDLGEEAKRAFDEVLESRGKVNILIAGRTGVGKSTLVNAVFQGKLAETGQGRPVTSNTRKITKEGVPVSIFDTRGLELAVFRDTLGALESLVTSRRTLPDPHRHIHVAWVCITEDSRRVEEAETLLVELFAQYIPVIAVITKARADQGFKRIAQDLLPKARNVVRVRVLEEQLDDGHVLAPMGLQELVELTMEVVPEGQKDAFAAAQKVSIDLKKVGPKWRLRAPLRWQWLRLPPLFHFRMQPF